VSTHKFVPALLFQIWFPFADDDNIKKTIRQIQHSIKRLTLLTGSCVRHPEPANKTLDERNEALLDSFDKLQENYAKSEENCR
jgi:hypothetical protein